MNALRFRKHLGAPISELPELASMVGKDIEIIVLDDSARTFTEEQPTSPLSAIEKVDAELGPIPLFDYNAQRGGWPEDERNDGFEEAVAELRRQPCAPKED